MTLSWGVEDELQDYELQERSVDSDVVHPHAKQQININALSPAECRVSGTGLHESSVGHPAEFTIEARDAKGNQRSEGGDQFFVAIRGASRVRARVTDHNDGLYSVTWTPPQSGAYNIAVSSFGIPLPGSPFAHHVKAAAPYAPNCVASGAGLFEAVARATQSFEVAFRDRLGHPTTAVDLDVYVESVASLPLVESASTNVAPQVHDPRVPFNGGRAAEAPATATGQRSSRDGKAGKAHGKGRRESKAEAPAANELSGYDSSGSADGWVPEGDGEEQAMTRRKPIRVKVGRVPLVVRAAEPLDSVQIGTINPGEMVTVLMERAFKDGKVRAMIAMSSVSRSPEVVSPQRKLTSRQQADQQQQPPPDGDSPPPARRLGETVEPVETGGGRGSEISTAGVEHEASGEPPSLMPLTPPHSPGGSSQDVGWVTLLKDGKKLVTSRVRQSAESRQQYREQWARRAAVDRAVKAAAAETLLGGGNDSYDRDSKLSKGGASRLPSGTGPSSNSISLEIGADPTGAPPRAPTLEHPLLARCRELVVSS